MPFYSLTSQSTRELILSSEQMYSGAFLLKKKQNE